MSPPQQEMFRNIEYLAWRGEDRTADAIALPPARPPWRSGWAGRRRWPGQRRCSSTLCAGRLRGAYQVARPNRDLHFLQISIRVLPDLIESAARSGARPRSQGGDWTTAGRLTTASGTHWALGVLERSAGVVAEKED